MSKGEGKNRSGKNSSPSLLSGKAYKESVDDLFKTTCLQPRDVDQKCVQLLDALHKAGKADEACKHLKTSLDGLAREKVHDWKKYNYKLLRSFDNEVYSAMKEKAAGSRQQKAKDKKEAASTGQLNTAAPEFRPGQWWAGAVPTVAAYPHMMMAPQMMMPQQAVATAGAPPPPPAKAAEVPKAETAEAAAPEKPADAPAAEAKEGADAAKTEPEAR